jgi:hypothetical protein
MKLSFQFLGATVLLLTVSSISCAEQQSSWQTLANGQGVAPGMADQHPRALQLLANEFLLVVDDSGQPVANANILLGQAPGNPFNDNVLKTDTLGKASIPADWKTNLPVTVQAPGYVVTTIPMAQPGHHTVQITRQEGQEQIEIKGTTNGYGRLIQDGKVDFGLVIPALSREQMLAFDVSAVISPQVDAIEIIGNRIDLPSNIALPRQNESYIFPIEFNKPDYRLFVRQPGAYKVTAIHGQFPLQRVVNDIRGGKSVFELINHFNFLEGGQKDVSVQSHIQGVNVEVNQARFDQAVSVKAPTLGGNELMIAISLNEQGGLLLPTDLKRLNGNQTLNLKAQSDGQNSILSLLMEETAKTARTLNRALGGLMAPLFDLATLLPSPLETAAQRPLQDFSRLSFAFLPATGSVQPQFLPLVDKPVLEGDRLTFQVPELIPGLTPTATYLVFSEVESLGEGNTRNERRTRLWEIWSPTWLERMELPKIDFARNPNRKYRWEVLFLASPAHFVAASGSSQQVDLKSITHVTRNATDI